MHYGFEFLLSFVACLSWTLPVCAQPLTTQSEDKPLFGTESSSVQPRTLLCRGSEVVDANRWKHSKVLVEKWVDMDLKDARISRQVFWAITHNDLLSDSELDCGFGLAAVVASSLRAIDYDDGPAAARSAFRYLKDLLRRLEPYKLAAKAAGWAMDEQDLAIYPSLLGVDAEDHDGTAHNCYGTALQIFVYSIEDMTRGVLHCQAGQWGVEALVPHWVRQGSCFTKDADKANLFLVPWHTWCDHMVRRLNETRGDISSIYINLMRRRQELLPHWSRNAGRDHIFLFSDQGMNFFPEWRDHIPHSIFLVTEALTPGCGPGCFSPWKDIVLPGHTDYFRYRRMQEWNLPTERRTLLFNFHGRYPGLHELYRNNPVRGKIIEMFMGKPGVSVGGFVEDYFEIMGKSHFCLIPMGTSSWTNHLYEAFFSGCIPVILSDGFEVPFQDILAWPDFSIKWPMHDVSMKLYTYLQSIPAEVLANMKAAVDSHACWFDYHQILEPASSACSPYLGMIRALERRASVNGK
eukprot:TRINITY_DN11452_c0_g4_i1.p1 TRINITY_DN11452_c0_g4~~TRINITY_DN11452_c0_g4_i1.p1  ORF type:complete len:520 (+),score=36.83 TRINITY_DN11452_c0_g4_i1:195-1754(+)